MTDLIGLTALLALIGMLEAVIGTQGLSVAVAATSALYATWRSRA